jgi:hypothetical protein
MIQQFLLQRTGRWDIFVDVYLGSAFYLHSVYLTIIVHERSMIAAKKSSFSLSINLMSS